MAQTESNVLSGSLKGKRALIVGVANDRSLAWSIAEHLHAAGCELAFTYLGEALERRVRPLAESVGAKLILPMNAQSDAEMDAAFAKVKETWGSLDILIHSVAFANREDLEGRFVDTSRAGYLLAMDVSAYSLVAMAKRAEPLMEAAGGGAVITLSYIGATRVVQNYNVMGVAKAALEATVRYLANDLGPKKIRVNAISAGPVKTLAAAGIRNFRDMLAKSEEKTPMKENIDQSDVGAMAAFLAGPGGRHITGTTMMIDSGAHMMGI
jgi:enoyl-[acyl-carrier protein] reductase I